MFEQTIDFIQSQYGHAGSIALHEPCFGGNEEKYLLDCIRSTFVSSVGKYVNRFEEGLAAYVNAGYAVATVNGTAALHVALILAGVQPGDEVVTQALTFVATANAISYCNAVPHFVDVERETLGLDPDALRRFLKKNAIRDGDVYRNKETGRCLRACVPMHTFGHPNRIEEILTVCNDYNIAVVEDAAESLGSLYRGRHAGTFGHLGVFSFNGNKTITCGAGGMVVTDNEALAQQAKHLTTTAKVPHAWEYVHDRIGFNYRMPNLNAALACAQIEQLEGFIQKKRILAEKYRTFFETSDIEFVGEPPDSRSNYWLNALVLPSRDVRDAFLQETNDSGIMTRPIWRLLSKLEMFKDAPQENLEVSQWLEDRIVNIPSSICV